MAIQKIAKIDEPHKDDRGYRGGLFRLWYEIDGCGYFRDVHQLEHDRLIFEQELLSRPITIADIEKYRKLIIDELQDEEAFEGNCI